MDAKLANQLRARSSRPSFPMATSDIFSKMADLSNGGPMGELVEVETISVQEPNIEVVETTGEEAQPLNDAVQLLYHPEDSAEGTYVDHSTDTLHTDTFASSDILTTPVAEREVVVSHLAPLTEQEQGIELGLTSSNEQALRKRRHEDGIDFLLWRKPPKAPRKSRGSKSSSRKSEPSRSILYDSSAARTEGTDVYQQTRKWQRKQVQMTTLEGEFTATVWASGTWEVPWWCSAPGGVGAASCRVPTGNLRFLSVR